MPPKSRKTKPNPVLANLETTGDKLKVYSLRHLLQNKRDYKTAPPATLGQVLEPWFQKEIQKPGDKLAGISELWLELLPPALIPHTRLAGFTKGTLTVQVTSAPVRAQIDGLLRGGLLKTIQLRSKGAVFRIKTTVSGEMTP